MAPSEVSEAFLIDCAPPHKVPLLAPQFCSCCTLERCLAIVMRLHAHDGTPVIILVPETVGLLGVWTVAGLIGKAQDAQSPPQEVHYPGDALLCFLLWACSRPMF